MDSKTWHSELYSPPGPGDLAFAHRPVLGTLVRFLGHPGDQHVRGAPSRSFGELGRIIGNDGGAAWPNRWQQRELLVEDAAAVAEPLEVTFTHRSDHPHIRLRDASQLFDLTALIRRKLQYPELRRLRRGQHRQRHAHQIVEVGRARRRLRTERRDGELAGRRLATRSGDRDDRGTELGSPRSRQFGQRLERVLDNEQLEFIGQSVQAPTHYGSGRAGLHRRTNEVGSVEGLSFQRHEELARLDRSRVRRDAHVRA